ncbi:MAG: YcxB family protein [Fimbriimonadaceae bacterium]|nr:YcxB family protein [Fimbriimonadaceae bacterium]
MEGPVSITWEPTAADIRQAVNYQFSRILVRFVVILPLVSGAGFVFYLVLAGESYRGGIVFGCALVYLLVCALLPELVVRRIMAGAGANTSRTEIFSDAGIEIMARGQVFNLPWSAITSAEDRASHFLLVQPGFPLPVPKRAFEDAKQEEHFRELLVRQGLLVPKRSK